MENEVKAHPERMGWSQGELARRLAVSRQTANAVETDKYDPSLPLALRMAKLFATTGMRSNAGSDEMMRQMSLQASAWASDASLLLFGGWATLAHLGFVGWMTPLTLLAGFAAVQLLAIFWTSGRKGMLKPR